MQKNFDRSCMATLRNSRKDSLVKVNPAIQYLLAVLADTSAELSVLSFSTYWMMIIESRASSECDLLVGRGGRGREGVGRVWGGRDVGGMRL